MNAKVAFLLRSGGIGESYRSYLADLARERLITTLRGAYCSRNNVCHSDTMLHFDKGYLMRSVRFLRAIAIDSIDPNDDDVCKYLEVTVIGTDRCPVPASWG